ncbi:hypothetical protein AMECASPLE_034978 [Ameca splendens]|uniref:Uncharacterized protein n=1 Tax=Ameca splendens TaxID=208324 RepID=A0ABV1ADM2_9TELE
MKDTEQWTLYTHTPHTYSILPGPSTDTDTPEGQPAPVPRRCSPSLRSGDRQTAQAPVETSTGTTLIQTTPAQIPTPNDPCPHPENGAQTKEGSTWSKRARQPDPAQDETVPNPQ